MKTCIFPPLSLPSQPYQEQALTWPKTGRHIMAHFDANSIYVYQAYRPSIARYALEHQQFGGDFSYDRMSWIKPNFLWMMYRAGWATKEGQECILAVRVNRSLFDDALACAVASTFDATRYSDHESWKRALSNSDVRLQWDPDHGPSGQSLPRRAIQLGLRGAMLKRYGQTDLISIEDMTPFVNQQREYLNDLSSLRTPTESIYQPMIENAALNVGLDPIPTR